MGYGSALAEFPLRSGNIYEAGPITVLRGPTRDGHFALLFFVNAAIPIWAPTTLPSLLLPAPAPFGGRININIPIIPAFPSAPDVSVVRLHATLGPQHLTYYERHHGRLEPYRPEGILLPNTCPRRGFPFAATLAFADGSHAATSTTVPCPNAGARPRRASGGAWTRACKAACAQAYPPIGARGFAPQNTCVPSIPITCTRLSTIDFAVALPTPTGPPLALKP